MWRIHRTQIALNYKAAVIRAFSKFTRRPPMATNRRFSSRPYSLPKSLVRKCFIEQLEQRELLATDCNFTDPCSNYTLTRHQNLPAAVISTEGTLKLVEHPTGSFPVHNTINFVRTD